MLKTNPFTCPKIRNFCRIHGRTFEEEPPHMRIKKSFLDAVWIIHGISFCMMNSMIIWPCCCWTSETEATENEVYDFYYLMCLIGSVCEKSVISSSNTEPCEYINRDTNKKCCPIHRLCHKIHWGKYEKECMVSRHKEDTLPLKFFKKFHEKIIPPSPFSQNKKTWLFFTVSLVDFYTDKTSLKSSFLPSPRYWWSAFLVAKSANIWARWRLGETVIPVSRIKVSWFHEKSVSKSTHWTMSQKSPEQAIVIIDALPMKDHSFIFSPSNTIKISISSPQTRLCSVYLIVGFEISLMCCGFVA